MTFERRAVHQMARCTTETKKLVEKKRHNIHKQGKTTSYADGVNDIQTRGKT
jgi:hypothetical protein